MARQDSYRNDTTITGTDRSTGIDATTGQTVNHLYSDLAEFVGAEFSISGNTITLPDGRTFPTGITSLLGVSLTNLPTTEPATVGLPWRQGQLLKISGQSTDLLELVSTDTGSGVEPFIDLYRNSSSPATSDVIGGLRFSGNNNSGTKINYGQVQGGIDIVTGNGNIVLSPSVAGVPTNAISISGGSTAVNNTLVASGAAIFSGSSITLASLPTTDPGIARRLWNDRGVPVLSGTTRPPVVSTTGNAITIDGVSTSYPGASGVGETNVQSNWNQTSTTDDSYIQNKPRIELSGTTNVMAGGLTLNGLPTTDPNTSNAIWNDGGIPRISGTTSVSTTTMELNGDQTASGNKTFTDNMTIMTSGIAGALTISSSDEGGLDAPDLTLSRDSSTPAINDEIGNVRYRSRATGFLTSNIENFGRISAVGATTGTVDYVTRITQGFSNKDVVVTSFDGVDIDGNLNLTTGGLTISGDTAGDLTIDPHLHLIDDTTSGREGPLAIYARRSPSPETRDTLGTIQYTSHTPGSTIDQTFATTFGKADTHDVADLKGAYYIQVRDGSQGVIPGNAVAQVEVLHDRVNVRGDISSTNGLLLTSPDGTQYRVTVANGGTLTTTAV